MDLARICVILIGRYAMPISLEIMPLEPVTPEPPPPKTMVVRYGYLKLIGEFQSDVREKAGCGSRLVVRTSRGVEMAEMLTTVCGNGGCNKSITRDRLLDYIDQSGGKDFPFTDSGRVLRLATAQDMAEQQRLDSQRDEYLKISRTMVEVHRVPMKIVEVEFLLGGEKVIFYFTSEHRVDFRSLVRDMAHQLHARIDLRQVGARDEARLVADYEKCGQHCCCKQFLKVLTPISMRAAKVQKATLDPAKISGRCGRLMCCLRYEDETYEDLRKRLPKKNSRVRTKDGEAWVLDGQILTQLVLLQYDNGNQAAVPMESIEAFDLPKPVHSSGRAMQFPGDGVEAASETPRRGPGGPGNPSAAARNRPASGQTGRPANAGTRRESKRQSSPPGPRHQGGDKNDRGNRRPQQQPPRAGPPPGRTTPPQQPPADPG
jgi:cell fate regulator YaaT (PSP1 superfamily)